MDGPFLLGTEAICLYARLCSTFHMAGARLLPLWVAAQGFQGVVATRYTAYSTGAWRRTLPCRVISVGNLTLGGTGKTPFTQWLAQWYQQHGWRVAVLSRGYKAQAAGSCAGGV